MQIARILLKCGKAKVVPRRSFNVLIKTGKAPLIAVGQGGFFHNTKSFLYNISIMPVLKGYCVSKMPNINTPRERLAPRGRLFLTLSIIYDFSVYKGHLHPGVELQRMAAPEHQIAVFAFLDGPNHMVYPQMLRGA